MKQVSLADLAKGVLLIQLQAIQAHQEGCILGEDPIHLHDLRVANRRTRSALRAFRKLFPEEIYARYKRDFRWIQQITGEVRDLDVGLSHYKSYQKQIAKTWRKHIKPIRIHLETKREQAQAILALNLQSDRFHEVLRSWSSVLNSDVLEATSDGLDNAKEFCSRRIIKRYRNIRNSGQGLSKKSPAKDFHSFRIKNKELRYLMEFMEPVIDCEDYMDLRTGLKRVQDALGGFQDTEVQIHNLTGLAEELYREGTGPDTLLAIGQLIGVLEKRIGKARKRSLQTIRWLIADNTARTFQGCYRYPVD
jgi:CHAD domain-containing protein